MKAHCVLILCLLPLISRAQTAELKGIVRDKQGDFLPMAHIMVLPDSVTAIADLDRGFQVRMVIQLTFRKRNVFVES